MMVAALPIFTLVFRSKPYGDGKHGNNALKMVDFNEPCEFVSGDLARASEMRDILLTTDLHACLVGFQPLSNAIQRMPALGSLTNPMTRRGRLPEFDLLRRYLEPHLSSGYRASAGCLPETKEFAGIL
jgi:hypothetical protein